MKMHERIGDHEFAGFFIRIPLGLYFALAGWEKLQAPGIFVDVVTKMKVLPEQVAVLYGILLPYVEIFAGGLLVLGAWTTLGAILCSLMLASFVMALGIYPDKASRLFNKDLVLLGASIALLYSGGGRFSIDLFRKNG